MNRNILRRVFPALVFPALLVAFAGLTPTLATAQATMEAPAAADVAGKSTNLSVATADIWAAAKAGDWDRLWRSLSTAPENDAAATALRADLETLRQAVQKRETIRASRVAKANAELEENFVGELTPAKASDALKHAIDLHELAANPAAKAAVLASDRVQRAVKAAEEMAHKAENDGQWLWSAELFSRLNLLLDVDGRYKADSRRLGDRLQMLRLYAPKRLWELRNERREVERQKDPKLSALPPYNGVGESYQNKLKDVSAVTVVRAMDFAGRSHVERVGLRKIVLGGLDAVRTLVTTADLRSAFPGVADANSRQMMLNWLDQKSREIKNAPNEPDSFALSDIVNDMMEANNASVKVLDAALLHEFGAGAFDQLDEFSAIIWPDELARFKRMTEASFPGVGIQIQMDEETQMIKVIMPIDGSPAFKAGVKSGDYIKKINNDSAIGMSVDQAIEQITGRTGTKVRITMERDKQDVEFELTRGTIPIYSVKGWKRDGQGDNSWDYYVDRQAKLGYVRMTGFTETTTRDLHKAIAKLKREGLNGLVLDLRFNPGGLLTEAVSVSNTFVNSGEIVYTMTNNGVRTETHVAEPDKVRLAGIPVIVLVNEGSASASEIVSGALKFYADQDKLNLLVLGNRSFGKGSVQNVAPLGTTAAVKLTTQYYYLPSGQLIHRREKATKWGVDPHLKVEMLPTQISDALLLRSDADLTADAKPVSRRPSKDDDDSMYRPDPAHFPPSPDRLLTEGIDLQLETAVFLLRSAALGKQPALAGGPAKREPSNTPATP